MTEGMLLIISGPAGSGKGTVVSELMKLDDGYTYSVSATTRSPRSGEKNGVNYFFVTREQFEEKIANGGMLTNPHMAEKNTMHPHITATLFVLHSIELMSASQKLC